MAIDFVGGIAAATLNGADTTLDLTAISGGIDTQPRENDIVLVFGAHHNGAGGDSTISTADYNELWDSGTTCDAVLGWKIMGPTPDTSVTVTGNGNTAYAGGAVAMVYRGIDLDTPIDVATTTATGASTNPDPPSITPTAFEAAVVMFAASTVNDSAIAAPTRTDDHHPANGNETTQDLTIAAAWRGGRGNGVAYNPGSWTGWSSGNWASACVALRPAATIITFVGGIGGSSIDGADVVLDLTALTGGIDTTAASGDFVLVTGGHPDIADAGVSTSGYSEIVSHSNTVQQIVSWKIMGGTPDTSVTCIGSGSASDGEAYIALVFRNIDPITPIDVTSTVATGSSTTPDSPEITTVTNLSVVVSAVLSASASGAVLQPLHDIFVAAPVGNDTSDATAGASFRTVRTAGVYNPLSWESFSAASWCSASVALRPFIPPPKTEFGFHSIIVGRTGLKQGLSAIEQGWYP